MIKRTLQKLIDRKQRQKLDQMVSRVMKRKRPYQVWSPANVYPSAKIGNGVCIGMFSEVGKDCVVGENTRIGKGAFICEGVSIGKNCFIGPHACFSNDKYPMSPKEQWKKTVVKDGASLGAGVMVLPGVTIGKNALVGMGSVVTKDIPDGETWCGNPARRMKK